MIQHTGHIVRTLSLRRLIGVKVLVHPVWSTLPPEPTVILNMALHPPSYIGHKVEDPASDAEASTTCKTCDFCQKLAPLFNSEGIHRTGALALPILDGLPTLDLWLSFFWLPTVLHHCYTFLGYDVAGPVSLADSRHTIVVFETRLSCIWLSGSFAGWQWCAFCNKACKATQQGTESPSIQWIYMLSIIHRLLVLLSFETLSSEINSQRFQTLPLSSPPCLNTLVRQFGHCDVFVVCQLG